MTYLIWVAMFGAASIFFLWLRDARIFFRTGLPLYRKAAYWGVLYGARGNSGTARARHHPWSAVSPGGTKAREDLEG
jgi:hypothetical protein